MRWWFIPLAILSMVSSAQAQMAISTGNGFLENCVKPTGAIKAYCSGYVAGFADYDSATDGLIPLHCRPPEVTYSQAYDILLAYLQNSPFNRHLPTATLFGIAMAKAYRCPTSAPPSSRQ
jgi:hypothetical protein